MISQSVFIHPSAIIEKGAIIHDNVHVGPFCIIGSQVEIGARTVFKSHIVVNGITRIGEDNCIYSFVSIGDVNQDLKYAGESTRVEIGNRNQIRESVTIHRGTIQGRQITRIGNDNLLMVNTHVAHDCIIGDQCIIANNVALGGHVDVDSYVIIGGMSAVHQFCIIGSYSIVGGCSGVAQDIPPFIMAHGNHATPFGLNIEGLKRRGFDQTEVFAIRSAYRIIYRSGKTIDEVKSELAFLAKKYQIVNIFLNFLLRSRRGIIRAKYIR